MKLKFPWLQVLGVLLLAGLLTLAMMIVTHNLCLETQTHSSCTNTWEEVEQRNATRAITRTGITRTGITRYVRPSTHCTCVPDQATEHPEQPSQLLIRRAVRLPQANGSTNP